MPAAKIDLTIEQGATFRKTFRWRDSTNTPIDLTGYTARMQIREEYDSSNYIIELTTANGGIAITEAEGVVDLFISDSNTAAITNKRGVYDLELITPSAEVIKFIKGAVIIIEEVTK